MKETGKGGGKMETLKAGKAAVCLHLNKREKRLSATPSFPPPHRWDLKQSIIGARFPWRTLLAKPQSDVFVSTFFFGCLQRNKHGT